MVTVNCSIFRGSSPNDGLNRVFSKACDDVSVDSKQIAKVQSSNLVVQVYYMIETSISGPSPLRVFQELAAEKVSVPTSEDDP